MRARAPPRLPCGRTTLDLNVLPCQNLIHNCRVLAVADHGPGPGGRYSARERAAPKVFGHPTKPGYGTLSQQNRDKPRRVAEAAAAALAIANAALDAECFGSDDEDDEDEPAVSEAEALQIDLSQERSPTRSPEAKRARGRKQKAAENRRSGAQQQQPALVQYVVQLYTLY